jgi:15-cis-phytoene desaturase
MQEYLGSMEGAVLSGKLTAKAISQNTSEESLTAAASVKGETTLVGN